MKNLLLFMFCCGFITTGVAQKRIDQFEYTVTAENDSSCRIHQLLLISTGYMPSRKFVDDLKYALEKQTSKANAKFSHLPVGPTNEFDKAIPSSFQLPQANDGVLVITEAGAFIDKNYWHMFWEFRLYHRNNLQTPLWAAKVATKPVIPMKNGYYTYVADKLLEIWQDNKITFGTED